MNGPIVVGVDASAASRAAAAWAVTEAYDRRATLRLVSVIEHERQRCQAEYALRLARAAVENEALSVSVEEVITTGPTSVALLEEASAAAMICLGTAHRIGAPLGAVTTTLAARAECAVAIIRGDGYGAARDGGVIAVVLDDESDNDAIVRQAMKEGRLRNATVRQIDRRVNSWVRRFPDVPVELVAAGTGRGSLPHLRELPALAVLRQAEADQLAGCVTPNCHPIRGYPDCSLLFVRDGHDEYHCQGEALANN